MAIYAIGDIQGCFGALERLLARLPFDPATDRLWLTGDLVNRGDGSLEVLRWARAHQRHVHVVLGNHDLHLLAVAAGLRTQHAGDTLDPILAAPDKGDLLDWLRHQPLFHCEDGPTGPRAMVHAGLLPAWTLPEARARAAEVERLLRAPDWPTTLGPILANAPERWTDDLTGRDRLAALVAILTRMRTLHADGTLCKRFTGPPQDAPAGCVPWYDHPHRRGPGALVAFGHWSALGLHLTPGAIALDTGCVWGRQLTAVRLDDRAIYQVDAREP